MIQPIIDAGALPRQLARTRRFSLGVPGQFTVSADGRRVLFVRAGGGTDPVSRLWLYQDGQECVLVDPASLVGVTAYAADAQTRTVACVLGGALWVVRTDEGAPFPVATAGPVTDPRPSPDGRLIAYVTDGALHVVSLESQAHQILEDARRGHRLKNRSSTGATAFGSATCDCLSMV